MNTIFHVERVYAFENKKYVVLEGNAKFGIIQPNMYIQVPFNNELSMVSPIYSVEEVDNGTETIKLLISCEEEGEVDFWLGINIADEMLQITSK